MSADDQLKRLESLLAEINDSDDSGDNNEGEGLEEPVEVSTASRKSSSETSSVYDHGESSIDEAPEEIMHGSTNSLGMGNSISLEKPEELSATHPREEPMVNLDNQSDHRVETDTSVHEDMPAGLEPQSNAQDIDVLDERDRTTKSSENSPQKGANQNKSVKSDSLSKEDPSHLSSVVQSDAPKAEEKDLGSLSDTVSVPDPFSSTQKDVAFESIRTTNKSIRESIDADRDGASTLNAVKDKTPPLTSSPTAVNNAEISQNEDRPILQDDTGNESVKATGKSRSPDEPIGSKYSTWEAESEGDESADVESRDVGDSTFQKSEKEEDPESSSESSPEIAEEAGADEKPTSDSEVQDSHVNTKSESADQKPSVSKAQEDKVLELQPPVEVPKSSDTSMHASDTDQDTAPVEIIKSSLGASPIANDKVEEASPTFPNKDEAGHNEEETRLISNDDINADKPDSVRSPRSLASSGKRETTEAEDKAPMIPEQEFAQPSLEALSIHDGDSEHEDGALNDEKTELEESGADKLVDSKPIKANKTDTDEPVAESVPSERSASKSLHKSSEIKFEEEPTSKNENEESDGHVEEENSKSDTNELTEEEPIASQPKHSQDSISVNPLDEESSEDRIGHTSFTNAKIDKQSHTDEGEVEPANIDAVKDDNESEHESEPDSEVESALTASRSKETSSEHEGSGNKDSEDQKMESANLIAANEKVDDALDPETEVESASTTPRSEEVSKERASEGHVSEDRASEDHASKDHASNDHANEDDSKEDHGKGLRSEDRDSLTTSPAEIEDSAETSKTTKEDEPAETDRELQKDHSSNAHSPDSSLNALAQEKGESPAHHQERDQGAEISSTPQDGDVDEASTNRADSSPTKSKEPSQPPQQNDADVVYLYVSLASGVRGSMGRYNRATTILKSYDINFVPVEITLNERALRLWKLKGVSKNKTLPAVFRDGDLKCDFNELVEANEIEDVEDLIFDGL